MKFMIHALTFSMAALFAASASTAMAEESAADKITVEDGYVRAVPPVSPTSAAFMKLTNTAQSAHQLKSAESDIAEFVELHTHTMGENGMHEMRKVEQIELPAGETTALKPGGLHVMFINLKNPLEAESQVDVKLNFEDGSSKELTLPVRKMVPMQGMDHSKHMDHSQHSK
jgi:periplasmic copper chaperone A